MLHVLYGFLFSLIMLVPSHSMGQIIIKENMDLEEQTYTGLSSVFSTSSLSALDLPSAIQYTAQSSGRLKLYLDEHIRYTKKLSENVVLEVQIKNGVKNIKKELVLSDYYDAPLTTPLWEECPETYYLFGKGPFYFNNTIESSEGGNALLKYSNIVSSHANSNYYEESLEEMVISFSRSSYEGRVIESKARSFLKSSDQEPK